MLKTDGISEKIGGVRFTKNINGSITIKGTTTEDIEYNLSGDSTNTVPLFALKKNKDYYLNIGGLDCEMKYYDGTTSQIYIGASGLINLNESKTVTQVLIKIPTGTNVNKTIYPMLEYGTSASPYEEYKSRKLTIDLSEYTKDMLFPSEDLYPDEDLFPAGINEIEYITIEDGKIKANIDGKLKYIAKGNVNLFEGYNNVYTYQNTYLEMEYYTNVLDVESLEFLQGKATTTNKFKILKDGSIEAHNGYFSGKIEATSGSFAGSITSSSAKITGGSIEGVNIDLQGTRNAERIRIAYAEDPQNNNLTLYSMGFTCRNDGSYAGLIPMGTHHAFELSYGDNFTYIDCTGIITPSVTQTSKAESKKNFELLENGLDIIKNTDIYKYHLKSQLDDDKKHIGFVIGDNFNYREEITSTNNDGVDLYSMIAVAYKAIQEQQQMIEQLQEEIKSLKESE
jgi:hypothetical protein